jgi:hypothetical protein
MSKKRSPTTRAVEPPRADNLGLINGIGPAVENRLNGVGIFTFAQLAAMSPADIAAAVSALAGFSSERILKQDWIGQASKLAAASPSSEAQNEGAAPIEPQLLIEHTHDTSPSVEPQKEVEPSLTAYHTATFTVELLLDENNNVHSSHVVHVQSRREHTWSDWPKAKLVDFMSQSAEVHVLSEEPVLTNVEKPEQTPVSVSESEKPCTSAATMPELAGMLHVRDMQISGIEPTGHREILSFDQPVDVRLTLDFTEMKVPSTTPLTYKATVFGKRRDPGSRSGRVVGESEGTIIPADTVTINIKVPPLLQGTYQLAATIMVALPDMKLTPKSGTMAVIDGGLVQVY